MTLLAKDGHTVNTSVPAEAVQLKAQGYREVKQDKPKARKPRVNRVVDAPAEKTDDVILELSPDLTQEGTS